MKIAFLNSGLALTKDGVADYTRTLALELSRQGHECCLLSVNDAEVAEITESDYGARTQRIPTLRLPRTVPWFERVSRAAAFLDAFAPDWISVQFVAYGFDPKGIVRGWAQRLEPLMRGRQGHVMLHELWVGSGGGGTLKHRLLGLVQRAYVAGLLKRISPRVLHTSNPTYANILDRSGIHARCLPLFGSVPLQSAKADEWLFPELEKSGITITSATRDEFWFFGFFGSLHPEWSAEPLLTRISAAAAEDRRRPVFVAIGRLGPGEQLWNQLACERAAEFGFARLGVRDEWQISQFMNSMDFMIATSPLGLIGKSSTVAAMLEHDLPVIVNREHPWRSGIDVEPLEGFARFIRVTDNFAGELTTPRSRHPRSRVTEVAQRLLAELQAVGEPRQPVASGSVPHLSRA